MNRTFAASLSLISILALAGCDDPVKLRFQVDKAIPEQTIPASLALCDVPITVPLLADPFAVVITQDQDFPEQNTNVNKIESAKLDSLSLTLTPASAEPSWDFLTALELYAEAQDLPRALVASIGTDTDSGVAIPTGATTLNLQPAGLQLAPYIKANGGFTLSSEATGCPPDQDAKFTGQVRINVVADPL